MIGQVTESGAAFDIIDALTTRCQGERLAPPAGTTGGEYDHYTAKVTAQQIKRLTAAGLISSRGRRADVLADVAGWDGDCSEFVAWYVSEGLAGLDQRRDRRNGDEWATQERPDELPPVVVMYLERLVFEPKRTYAEQYAEAILCGHPLPADPGTDWAIKARRKVTKLVQVAS